jgi:dipeptidyl aminopeptidase/acylaminoacyl peptidase
MRLSIGARLGPYEITGVLGSGGMGEVYRARDSRLGREVALKILPEQLAEDASAFSRFELEARAVAALSHPNILAIHEFGHADSTAYAVMELLEGSTLRERLRDGALPTRKAIDYAAQIAGALAAAHAKGIIHRDLKPDNIFITTDGRVKLLDFGLAAQRDTGLFAADSAASRTMGHKTSVGTLLGTVGYMSPEQVRGETADHRSDIFSFGCVLIEMLTGKRAFERPTPAEIMTAILREDAAEITGALVNAAPGIEHIVQHCLEKNPEERFQSARDLAFDLQAALTGSIGSGSTAGAAVRRRGVTKPARRAWMLWAAGLLVAAAAVIGTRMYWPSAAPAPPTVFSEIVPPEGIQFGALAVAPDGHRLAFVGWKNGRGQLWVRSLDSLDSRPLAGTAGAAFPFWSPDGAQIGFFADGRLKTIPASGGPVQALADAPNARGGSWSEEGAILFAPGYSLPLYRVTATGGAAEPVTQLDPTHGEISHRWPCFLPGGKKFLYFAYSSSPDNTGIFAGSLDGKTHRLLVRSGYGGVYAAPGYLIFTRQKALLAQAFRADTLKLEGKPITLAEAIGVNELEYAHFSVPVSGGVLAYRRGGSFLGSELRWFARDGRPQATVAATDRYWSTRLSPDGRSVALEVQDPHTRANNIWLYDLEPAARRRLTFGAYDTVSPQWSPDGGKIAYSARPGGQRYWLYQKAASGGSQEELLLKTESDIFAQDWSRDGRFLLCLMLDSAGKRGGRIWLLPMQGERKSIPLPQPTGDVGYPRFSPDSRWIAYRSNESGQNEIYVIPAHSAEGKWQVSVGGGDWPVWRADGKELYYIGPDDRLMAVPVHGGTSFAIGAPQPLFQTNVLKGLGSRYDASHDGKRFLFLVTKQEDPAPLTLVVNWASAMKK